MRGEETDGLVDKVETGIKGIRDIEDLDKIIPTPNQVSGRAEH